jgi:protein-tyrosine phosphatase
VSMFDVDLRTMEHTSHVVLDGATNVRDLTWALSASRQLGTKRLFRSANLDQLSAQGRLAFAELRVGVVIDLRGKREAAAAPEFEGTKRVHLPIEPTVVAKVLQHHAAGTLNVASAIGIMESTYRHFIVNHTEVFTGVFRQVLQAKKRPVLFHCAAGKDRTGVAAALILTAMGVAPSVVMEDYLLSNQFYRPPSLGVSHFPDEVRDAILKVRPSYLEAALGAMIEVSGGADQYLEKALGIGVREREAIREAMI